MLSDWNELSDEARKEIDPQYWQKLPDRTEEEKSKSNRLINVYVSMARAIRENLPGVNFRRLSQHPIRSGQLRSTASLVCILEKTRLALDAEPVERVSTQGEDCDRRPESQTALGYSEGIAGARNDAPAMAPGSSNAGQRMPGSGEVPAGQEVSGNARWWHRQQGGACLVSPA